MYLKYYYHLFILKRVFHQDNDSHVVDSLFDAISQLQLLHPDPIKEEEDDDDGMFMTANGWVSVEDHVTSLFEKAAVCIYCILLYLG